MEKRIMKAFDTVVMPNACAEKIRQMMQSKDVETEKTVWTLDRTVTESYRGWIPAAVVCVLAMALLWGQLLPRGQEMPARETATQAATALIATEAITIPKETPDPMQEKVEQLKEELETVHAKFRKKFLEGTVKYTVGNVTYLYSDCGRELKIFYDTSLHSPFTEYLDDRVYFIANGEYLDITDQFSEEEPFTYIYTDEYYIAHYIAIGGTPENIGYLELLEKVWSLTPSGGGCGFGVNTWNDEAEERYGWETKAKEIFWEYGIYWA